MPRLKDQFALFIYSPPYDEGSGGVRALYLLCHNLNRRGFTAFVVTPEPKPVPKHLRAPVASAIDVERAKQSGRECVAIYPEVVGGNPFNARIVIRYLLNKPGSVSGPAHPRPADTYGADDLFLHFDASHVPPGRQSYDMFMPVVDRKHYRRPVGPAARSGFVICSRRPPKQALAIPEWVSPRTVVTPLTPRTHQELGDIYRSCRAMIAYERSTAIYEALCCGCPVIGIPSPGFDRATYQPRFGGAGMGWAFDEAVLADATAGVDRFARIYDGIETGIGVHVEETFIAILKAARVRTSAA